MQQRDAKIILKMINHKYWNQLLYPQWSRHCRSHSVVLGFPSCRPTKCCGKTRYWIGPEAHSEIRYRSKPTRRWSRHPDKSRDTLVQQLDSTEVSSSRHQRTGSKIGYGCLNVHTTLRSASVCICDLLPLII